MEHAQGKWIKDYGGTKGHIKSVTDSDSNTPTVARYDIFPESSDHYCTQDANGELIAEAGTVTNETGYTPRQLANQKAELLKALNELRLKIGNLYPMDKRFGLEYKKAMSAIKKATE
jgi:hypothetical protein